MRGADRRPRTPRRERADRCDARPANVCADRCARVRERGADRRHPGLRRLSQDGSRPTRRRRAAALGRTHRSGRFSGTSGPARNRGAGGNVAHAVRGNARCDDQRGGPRAARCRRSHAACGAARRCGLVRHEGGLRRRRVRRVHGMARRTSGDVVSRARLAGARRGRHDDRRLGGRQRAASAASRVRRSRCGAVRLLHPGDADGRREAARRARRADARGTSDGDQRKHLPLHRVPQDSGRDAGRRERVAAQRAPREAAPR